MPNITLKTGQHLNEDAIGRLLNYMVSSPYIISSGSRRVLSYNLQTVIDSFKVVQDKFDKTDGKRIHHIIIGFHEKDLVANGIATQIAEDVVSYLEKRFQCCYVVHHGSSDNPNYIHIHLAVNTISWLDGRRMSEELETLYNLAAYLRQSTGEYYTVQTQASTEYDPE